MIIQDKIALGTFAGLIATIPQFILNFLSVQLGFAKWYSFQIGGSIYLHPGLTDSFQGALFGTLVWLIPAAALGVIVSYIIYFTGEEYWWIKGIGVTMVFMFLFIYGFLYTLGGATIVPFDFATNMTVFMENILYGFIVGYLIKNWGQVKIS